MILIYLASGLFLGWSLGANDTANIFGTAVGTKMVRFRTAAIIASVFVIIGAVMEGSGASQTLGKLGSINAIGGSFTVALSAAITVTSMTKLRLPVSTSQAVVGAIIGWNFFSKSSTDIKALIEIVTTWILCPVIAGFVAYIFYHIFKAFLGRTRIHMLEIDNFTRIALILAGAFGAYSLGANNIANVMGVFVKVSPFSDFRINDIFTFTGTQQLFLLGAIAISIGIFTYSLKVMKTVGNSLYKLSPITALIVVLAESFVLFIFGSKGLQELLSNLHIPPIPLVPVSSSQAVIGAILGIAIAKGGGNIQFKLLGKISLGWITTPLIAGLISFITLFFVQNVFQMVVFLK
jgi:PiT family inorganic phosphate transporter